MCASPLQLPDSQILLHSLNAIINNHKCPGDHITILAREPNPRASTSLNEIVTCRLADGNELRLLCKYATGRSHNSYGHRGGVAYEAQVYRHVLKPLPISAPMFYGAYEDEESGQTWLFLEYLDDSAEIRISHDPPLMRAAARWLGQFHRANQSRLSPASLPFLHRHDADYYLGWAERTSRLAGPLHQRFPWLATLCKRFEQVVDLLLEPPAIIVHGEYYTNNILSRQGTIYPVDWESTAVAIAELDLASLMEGWPSETARACKLEYQAARWPEGPPADFEQRLDLAKLYWRFRWLGERSDWTTEDKSRWRYDELRSIGERLSLI